MLSRLTKITARTMAANSVRALATAGAQHATPLVITEEVNNKGVLTLNRPKALNSINVEMILSIRESLENWEKTKSMVIVKGAGEKSFCAGGDIRELSESRETNCGRLYFGNEYTTNHLIGTYKIPYVALIDGITMGGGVGLSVHGKYRIATERTMFAMPETGIGLFPDVGGSYFLPRLPGKLGFYLGLTGFRLRGKDVLKSGIATHYCESARLPDLEKDLLENSANEIDRILSKHCSIDDHEFVLAKHLKQIDECFNASTVEGILNNLEKDGSEWAKKTLETLSKMSPLSMKVTLRELILGSNLSFAQCFQMEYKLGVQHIKNSDFHEGVRALIVDKDNKPKWNPPKVEEVTEDRVQEIFGPLPNNEELILENRPLSKL